MLIVAHRSPAGSPSAIALARAGATVFEFDVRLPPDGRPPVVTHFSPLGPPAARLYHDGWRLRRAIRWNQLGPSLPEAIAQLPLASEVLLDIKGPVRNAAAAAERLAEGVAEPRRTHVCGNVGPVAAAVEAMGMRVWRSVGTSAELVAALRPDQRTAWAFAVQHSFLTETTLADLKGRSPRVIAWTVNSPRRARDLLALGVDGVITDSVWVAAVLRDARES